MTGCWRPKAICPLPNGHEPIHPWIAHATLLTAEPVMDPVRALTLLLAPSGDPATAIASEAVQPGVTRARRGGVPGRCHQVLCGRDQRRGGHHRLHATKTRAFGVSLPPGLRRGGWGLETLILRHTEGVSAAADACRIPADRIIARPFCGSCAVSGQVTAQGSPPRESEARLRPPGGWSSSSGSCRHPVSAGDPPPIGRGH